MWKYVDYPGNTHEWSHSFPCFHVCYIFFPIDNDMRLCIPKDTQMFLHVSDNKLKMQLRRFYFKLLQFKKSNLAPDMTWVIFVFSLGREFLDWLDSFLLPLLPGRRVAYDQIYKIAKYSIEYLLLLICVVIIQIVMHLQLEILNLKRYRALNNHLFLKLKLLVQDCKWIMNKQQNNS